MSLYVGPSKIKQFHNKGSKIVQQLCFACALLYCHILLMTFSQVHVRNVMMSTAATVDEDKWCLWRGNVLVCWIKCVLHNLYLSLFVFYFPLFNGHRSLKCIVMVIEMSNEALVLLWLWKAPHVLCYLIFACYLVSTHCHFSWCYCLALTQVNW